MKPATGCDYETGEHKSAVGTASVVSVNASDPESPGEDQGWEGVGQAGDLAEVKGSQALLLIRRWCGREVECGSVDAGAVRF